MFGLVMVPREGVLVFSFIFLIIRLVPGNVFMVAIDMCGKAPSQGSGYMELHENMY